MMVTLTTDKVRYLVDEQGNRSDVLLNYDTWQEVLDALELLEDLTVARDYMARRKRASSPEAMGLIPLPKDLGKQNNDDAGMD